MNYSEVVVNLLLSLTIQEIFIRTKYLFVSQPSSIVAVVDQTMKHINRMQQTAFDKGE